MRNKNGLLESILKIILIIALIVLITAGIVYIKRESAGNNNGKSHLSFTGKFPHYSFGMGNYCFAAAALGLLKKHVYVFDALNYTTKEDIIYILRNLHSKKKSFHDFYPYFDKIIKELKNSKIVSGQQNDSGEFLVSLFENIIKKLISDHNAGEFNLLEHPFVKAFCFVTKDDVRQEIEIIPTLSSIGKEGVNWNEGFSQVDIDSRLYFRDKEITQIPEVIFFCPVFQLETEQLGLINNSFMIQKTNHQLNLKYTENGTDKQITYDLIGASIHQGLSDKSGHYIYYVKEEKNWKMYSDNDEVPMILRCKYPSIFMYKKVDL
ncbi:ubiquitin carboxyl-terminal hydrolase 26 [Tubulinosema ratisbonensis]|uniref:Ubiquitin carboxyl-terminal hydrolase 26 n=1 Tax=Tubulinosema ratisbonensis TaxID=291195 RepID=A0A437AJ61_9MICR|nr:ubiquitin carboxyl-terminal hydrolase 26 [Tubulinosema ratisbonensis]